MWGTCGKDGVGRGNWRLVQLPPAVMEYVVAHEVCHLVDRSHSRPFGRLLGGVMPDWRERKALLEIWEGEYLSREEMGTGATGPSRQQKRQTANLLLDVRRGLPIPAPPGTGRRGRPRVPPARQL